MIGLILSGGLVLGVGWKAIEDEVARRWVEKLKKVKKELKNWICVDRVEHVLEEWIHNWKRLKKNWWGKYQEKALKCVEKHWKKLSQKSWNIGEQVRKELKRNKKMVE